MRRPDLNLNIPRLVHPETFVFVMLMLAHGAISNSMTGASFFSLTMVLGDLTLFKINAGLRKR